MTSSAISRLRNSIKFDSIPALEDWNNSSFLRQSFLDDFSEQVGPVDADAEDESVANDTNETSLSACQHDAAIITTKLESDTDVSTEALQRTTATSEKKSTQQRRSKQTVKEGLVVASPPIRKSKKEGHRGSKTLKQIKDEVTLIVSGGEAFTPDSPEPKEGLGSTKNTTKSGKVSGKDHRRDRPTKQGSKMDRLSLPSRNGGRRRRRERTLQKEVANSENDVHTSRRRSRSCSKKDRRSSRQSAQRARSKSRTSRSESVEVNPRKRQNADKLRKHDSDNADASRASMTSPGGSRSNLLLTPDPASGLNRSSYHERLISSPRSAGVDSLPSDPVGCNNHAIMRKPDRCWERQAVVLVYIYYCFHVVLACSALLKEHHVTPFLAQATTRCLPRRAEGGGGRRPGRWLGEQCAHHHYHHHHRRNKKGYLCLKANELAADIGNAKVPSTLLPESSSSSKESRPKSFRTEQQQRQKPKKRRPKFYWSDISNVERELRDFWTHCGVDIHQHKSGKEPIQSAGTRGRQKRALCIPNETLLNYFGRHDLRAAIVAHGGREELCYELRGGATVMSGKWSEAVETSIELQILLQNKTLVDLSKEGPPPSLQQLPKQIVVKNDSNAIEQTESLGQKEVQEHEQLRSSKTAKWSHQSGRKPLGYWNQQRVVVELYEYLDEYRVMHGRPAVWLPRPSEMKAQGRADLALAMGRFGGTKRTAQLAGLIPFREWNFFEGQYELLLLLKEYLDEHHQSSVREEHDIMKYQYFPSVSEIHSRGHDRLYLLIQYYGGRKFLSSRLGMTTRSDIRATVQDANSYKRRAVVTNLSWGQFSIEFAIKLNEFIRKDHMQATPPISDPVIAIPRPVRLQRAGAEGLWLHEKIMQFGGYENVARRLYLEYKF